jgi:hypothetical protein
MKERKREFEEDKITGFFDKDTEIKGELSFKGSFRWMPMSRSAIW